MGGNKPTGFRWFEKDTRDHETEEQRMKAGWWTFLLSGVGVTLVDKPDSSETRRS